jgi:anti-sigma factor (TIGR02949 family)
MSGDCDRALANLYAYLDAELDGVSAEQVRAHVEACNGCGGQYSFEKRLLGIVRERLTEDPPEDFFDRIKALLAAEPANPS